MEERKAKLLTLKLSNREVFNFHHPEMCANILKGLQDSKWGPDNGIVYKDDEGYEITILVRHIVMFKVKYAD